MKKFRILALVLAVFALTAMLFLVSCDKDDVEQDSCAVNGHKWTDSSWKSNGDATCTQDGTRSRKCPVCKTEEVEPDPDTATGHYFIDYVLDGDATCLEDGHETSKCYICQEATDTRLAEGSALGHRWGTQPISNVNGFLTLRCLRAGCGEQTVMDDGTIDEDFEHTDGTFVRNTKRYVSEGAVATIEGTDNKYLFLEREDGRITGDSAFGIFFTPDYSLYKNKKYVFEFDLLITENTRDLDLLVGKKVNTEQVFASYDSETGKIVANGTNLWTVTKGEWLDVAFVLDDINFVYDVYIESRLVASQVVYSDKNTYFMPSNIDWLAVRMVAEPKTASEFGIDNIKTYVGKAIENPGEPLVKLHTTSKLATVNNLYGNEYNDQWLDDFFNTTPDYRDAKTGDVVDLVANRAKFDKSISVATVEKDGNDVDVIKFENFSSGFPQLNLYNLQGVPKNDQGYYDLTQYEKMVFEIYSESPTDFGIMFNIQGPNQGGISYFGLKQVVKPGWNTYEIVFTQLPGATRNCRLDNIRNLNICCSGWPGSIGVAPGYDGKPVDGYTFYVTGIYLHGTVDVSHVKPAEDCEHVYGEPIVVPSSCVTAGYTKQICSKCEGEKIDESSTRPMEKHSFEVIKDIAATCTEGGYYSEKCSVCNLKNRTDRAALGHTESTAEGYAAEVIAPTCYSTGITKRLCAVCNETYETDPTAMLPHEWNEGEVTTEPTCVDKGVKTFICIHNGENGCDGVKTEDVDALGHTADPTKTGELVAPSCVEGGYLPQVCSVCSADYKEYDGTEPTGHNMAADPENEGNVAPTCFAKGTIIHVCLNGCTYTEAHEVEMIEHTWPENGEVTTPPTCSTEGVETFKCTVEGCEGTKTEPIATIPHTEVNVADDPDYEAVQVKVTCTTDGYVLRHCSVCDQDYQDNIVEALGHSTEGVEHEIVIADCVTDGYERAKCKNEGCEEYEYFSQTPSKGGHALSEIKIDPATKKLKQFCSGCEKDFFITYAESLPAYADMIEALGGKALIKFGTKCLELNKVYGGTALLDQVILGNGDKASGTPVGSIRYYSAGNTFVAKDNGGADGVGNYIQWNMKAVKEPLGAGVANHCYINPFVSAPAGRDVVFSFSMRLGQPGADGKYCGTDFQIIDRNSTAFNSTGNKFVTIMKLDNDGVLTLASNSKKIVEFTQDKFINVALSIHTGKGTVDVYVDGELVMLNAALFDAGTSKNVTDWTKLKVQEIRGWQYSANVEVGFGSYYDLANITVYAADMPYAITGADIDGIRAATTPLTGNISALGSSDAFEEWFEEFKPTADAAKVDMSVSVGSIEKDGQQVPVIEYTGLATGLTQWSIYNIKGFNAKDNGRFDLSDVQTVILEFYNHGEKDYMFCFGLQCDNNNGMCYFGSTTLVAKPGWNTIEVNVSTMDKTRSPNITNIRNLFVAGGGWYAGPVDPATGKGTGAVDDYKFSFTGIYLKTAVGYVNYVAPIDDCEHNYEEVVVAPTTENFGYTKKVCSVCQGEQVIDGTYVEHLHTVVDDAAVDPTCDTTGLTAGSHCSTCGKVIVAQKVVEALGHTWNEGEVTTEPGCGAEGVKTFKCTVDGCDGTKTEPIPAAGEHSWDEGVVTTPANCGVAGVKTFTCSSCQGTKTEEIAATGEHSWDEGVVTTPANCGVAGVKTFTCSVCQGTKTEEIAATGEHSWNEGEITTPPTCVAGVKTFTCSVCQNTKTEEVAAVDDHDFTGEEKADFTTGKLGKSCTVCGAIDCMEFATELPAYTDMITALGDKVINGFNTNGFEDSVVYAGSVSAGVGTPLAKDITYAATSKTIRLYMAGNSAVVKDNGGADGVNKYVQWNMKNVKTPDGFASANHCYINVNTNAPAGADVVFSFSLRLGTPDANGKYCDGGFNIIDRGCTAFEGAAANKFLVPMSFTQDGAITISATGEKVVQFSQDKFTNVAFAFHCSKGTMDVYVDGELVAYGVGIFDPNTNASVKNWANFQIDELRIMQYSNNVEAGLGSWIDLANITTYKADKPVAITGVAQIAE